MASSPRAGCGQGKRRPVTPAAAPGWRGDASKNRGPPRLRFGVNRAKTSCGDRPYSRNRTEPSAKRNCAPTGWAEPPIIQECDVRRVSDNLRSQPARPGGEAEKIGLVEIPTARIVEDWQERHLADEDGVRRAVRDDRHRVAIRTAAKEAGVGAVVRFRPIAIPRRGTGQSRPSSASFGSAVRRVGQM